MSEPDPTTPEKNTPVRWTAGAIAVFAIGLLILIPSGICTGVIGVLSLFDGATDFGEFLVIVLPVGGLPMVIGAALVYAGLKLRRRD